MDVVRKMGGNFHLKLNIDLRPIANKYREGKMKRTLERELKVPEIAKREANGTSFYVLDCCWLRGFLGSARAVSLTRTPMMFLLLSCHRVLGAWRLSSDDRVFASVSSVLGVRSMPRYFCACSFHWGIIGMKVVWSPGLLISDSL